MTVTAATDLWHHYGRTRAATDRTVPRDFRWSWGQDSGPGAEVLGDLSGRIVGDLGAGAARHAAHLATRHQPSQVVAVDASPAQSAMATDLFGHLAPRLRIVGADLPDHLLTMPCGYHVLYSVFGAVDFTNPRELLPAAFTALRPGGRLVFSTLAHHLGGAPARPGVAPAAVSARTPEGGAATLHRWVLRGDVWTTLLDEAGFTGIQTDVLPAAEEPRAASTLLVSATRPES